MPLCFSIFIIKLMTGIQEATRQIAAADPDNFPLPHRGMG